MSDEEQIENKYSQIPYSDEQKKSEEIKALLEKARIKNKEKTRKE